ncbi:MAG TPA: polysaccharide biosynthesis tyrosine autokinase [Gemmatimonadales bacterium]|nr:polysaccharide biosynthesis tyrosine autokinase [Gemmatimonadales bacterium]
MAAVQGPAPEPGAGQLARILAALRRFAALIVLVTVAGSVISVLATRFLKPKYVVSSRLHLQNIGSNESGPIQAPEVFSSYNWVELAKTFAVLDPVVRSLKLYLHPGKASPSGLFDGFELAPRFTPGEYQLTVDTAGQRYSLRLKEGVELTSGLVTDSVGRQAGFLWVPGPAKLPRNLKASFQVMTPRDAAADLGGQLNVRLNSERGSFLILSLEGTDPVRLAETINSVQEQFVEVATDLKRRKLQELSKVLDQQVRQQEDKLRWAEQALESFKVATITQPREEVAIAAGLQMTQNPAYSRYFEQRVRVETIRNERRAIEDVLTRLAAGELTVDAFHTIPTVAGAPDLHKVLGELSVAEADLRALGSRYTNEYRGVKDLQDKITTIKQQTIPVYALALVRQLRIQEGELESRIATAGQELRSIPVRAITEARLQREVESARVLAVNLRNRYEENKLAELSAIPDVRILDAAVAPTRPSRNRAPQIILVGMALSLTAGLGLAVLLDRLDKRFRYPEQASQELGLSILGAIPAIPRPKNGRPLPQDEMHQVIEAFRSVRLNVAHSFDADSPICLTVSSPSPGDGKSLISANLALSFAEAGYRTLLLDGDTRRGDLHRTFAAERRPGLLDYLGSTRLPLDRAFRPTSHPRLTLLPSGTRLQHGPELLGSVRMAELVAQLRSQFDVVLIDSPPLGAGIDPFVLGTHSGNMLIVLRSGETDRQMAEVKLRILDRLPVRILGAVLNHIHAGTGPYKYYSYSYGYASEEDEISEGKETRALPEGAAS